LAYGQHGRRVVGTPVAVAHGYPFVAMIVHLIMTRRLAAAGGTYIRRIPLFFHQRDRLASPISVENTVTERQTAHACTATPRTKLTMADVATEEAAVVDHGEIVRRGKGYNIGPVTLPPWRSPIVQSP
jgi:hypothetical protein